jgi:hypothetical protein
MAFQGSCLCGTVRYDVDGPFTTMLSCHCSMCRKHHGAPFATYANAALAGFRWTSGERALGHYAASRYYTRSFCTTCGAVAPSLMPGEGLAFIPAGTLDGDPGIKVQGHMFVGSKAPWYDITDTLPQYETYPPSLGDVTPLQRATVHAEPGTTAGSCLCGAVAYEISGAAVAMYQCHCSRCRKGRAAAHGANLFYKTEAFRWTRGESWVVDYKLPEAARFGLAFCRQCGGSTPRVSGGTVVVPAGPLDTDPMMRPLAHIFVASKAPWFEITDSIPQLAEAPPPPRAAR